MTSQEQALSAEQTEFIAVGASVGAGCRPCLSHHLKAGAQAGLGGEQLLATVASAERVTAEAAVAIGDHARAELDANITSPALLSRLEEALASLGGALGANDPTNIERQLRAAADLGATRSQLQQAIDTAHTVEENAARIHLREAERLLDALAPAAAAAQTDTDHAGGCGCGASDETQEAPVTTADDQREDASVTAEERVASTSGHPDGCREMATKFAAGDALGPMAGCREMFERFMPAGAPTKTNRAPATTTASGACKKEV
jgi:AhpD family alkylhydroperoxidase